MKLTLCPHCQRHHPPQALRCPENQAQLDLAGRELEGRYRFTRCIGQSASSQVWQAKHLRTRRRVAVKLLAPQCLDDASLRARLEREGELAGRIYGDQVVSVFDQGECALGPYLVMEWIDGETLETRLLAQHESSGPLPLKKVLVLSQALARALVAMHSAGVVHRDLKPGNIMVRGQGPHLLLKVLDFGLAKGLLRPGEDEHASKSVGTPAYMAPEQFQDAGKVDERADIYAFGVILRQMLCGLDRPEGAQGEHGARELEALPSAWRELCAACLAPQKEQRPASAQALSQRLSRLDDTPTLAAAPKPRRSRRPWVIGVGAGGLALCLVAGLGAFPSAKTGSQELCSPAPTADSQPREDIPDLSWAARAPVGPRCLSLSQDGEAPHAAQAERVLPVSPRVRRTKLARPPSSARGAREPKKDPGAALAQADQLGLVPAQPSPPKIPSAASIPAPSTALPRPAVAQPERIQALDSKLLRVGALWTTRRRSSPMGFFDARQYCESLAQGEHQGLTAWRLATSAELVSMAHAKGVKPGWYWANELRGGKAKVIRLPSTGHFYARVGRRFVRPFCVVDREVGRL